MVGLFDSGVGGANVLRFLRESLNNTNIIFLRDAKNCPYGTKTKGELIEITERNIAALRHLGADRILVACCTASSLIDEIDVSLTDGVLPIISPTVKAARSVSRRGIGVIATDFTVNNHVFGKAARGISVIESSAQSLVPAIESGVRDENADKDTEEQIRLALEPLRERCDTLVLGCTHFSSLKKTVGRLARQMGITNIIDSARVGADALVKALGGKDEGLGLTYRLCT